MTCRCRSGWSTPRSSRSPDTKGLDGKFSDAAYPELPAAAATDRRRGPRQLHLAPPWRRACCWHRSRPTPASRSASRRLMPSMLLEAREAEIAIVPIELFARRHLRADATPISRPSTSRIGALHGARAARAEHRQDRPGAGRQGHRDRSGDRGLLQGQPGDSTAASEIRVAEPGDRPERGSRREPWRDGRGPAGRCPAAGLSADDRAASKLADIAGEAVADAAFAAKARRRSSARSGPTLAGTSSRSTISATPQRQAARRQCAARSPPSSPPTSARKR